MPPGPMLRHRAVRISTPPCTFSAFAIYEVLFLVPTRADSIPEFYARSNRNHKCGSDADSVMPSGSRCKRLAGLTTKSWKRVTGKFFNGRIKPGEDVQFYRRHAKDM